MEHIKLDFTSHTMISSELMGCTRINGLIHFRPWCFSAKLFLSESVFKGHISTLINWIWVIVSKKCFELELYYIQARPYVKKYVFLFRIIFIKHVYIFNNFINIVSIDGAYQTQRLYSKIQSEWKGCTRLDH